MSEWISVDEQLPLGTERLMVYLDGRGDQHMCVGYWNRLTRGYIVSGESHEGLWVTHWQPLPAPPAKETA